MLQETVKLADTVGYFHARIGHPVAHAFEGRRCIINSTMTPRPYLSAICGVLALQ